ncbi:MAG: N-acyl homoserine lactonase family protein [Deltaproteobacteria bacterium]|nr:MAG: N-acyl homoserine lactonase family protein [Deltaproteobacteria bacterium]
MSDLSPTYEIYAVKYAGPLVGSVAMLLWNTDWDQKIERNYYVWVVRGNGETLIVDCGVAPALAEARQIPGYINPAHVLARIGVEAFQVKRVVITHVNFDHISGIELFPNAAFYIQEREFNFWIKDPIAKKPPFLWVSDPVGNAHLAKLEGTERLVLLDGDEEILPGIELLLAPGHTPGLQVVAVNTTKGTAILGSDCGHLFRNYEEEIPSIYITDLVAWMKTYDKVKAKVSSLDLLFPGHDVKMSTDYPKVAEDITRLV